MSENPHFRIGVADVGKRVTVRYALAEPTATASATDVVGLLISWPDDPQGDLVVEDRHGAVRCVPIDQVIAARRVGG